MNSDIRLKVTFPNHHKTKKLYRKLGPQGPLSLIYLWLYAAENKPDGRLEGMDEEDIAIAAQWPDATSIAQALLELRFLELEDGVYHLHGWSENNAWAADAIARSEKARTAAKVRWEKKNGVPSDAQASKRDAQASIGDATGTKNDAPCNAPSPLPSPSPSIEETTIIEDPPGRELSMEDEVVMSYHKFCPSFPHVLDLGSSTRWMLAKSISAKYSAHEGGMRRFLDTLFKKAEASDRLTNRDGGWKGYRVNLDWLLKEENYQQVIEGRYDNGNCPPAQGARSGGKKQGYKGMSDGDKKTFLGPDE